MDCEASVQKMVCMEAEVTVEPLAEAGEIQAYCVGEPRIERCPCPTPHCSFIINQLVCLKIPIQFSAMGFVEASGISCDIQCPEPCKPEEEDCGQRRDGYIDNRGENKNIPTRSFALNYQITYKNNPITYQERMI